MSLDEAIEEIERDIVPLIVNGREAHRKAGNEEMEQALAGQEYIVDEVLEILRRHEKEEECPLFKLVLCGRIEASHKEGKITVIDELTPDNVTIETEKYMHTGNWKSPIQDRRGRLYPNWNMTCVTCKHRHLHPESECPWFTDNFDRRVNQKDTDYCSRWESKDAPNQPTKT